MGRRQDGAAEQRRIRAPRRGTLQAATRANAAQRRRRGSHVAKWVESSRSVLLLSLHSARAARAAELHGALSRRQARNVGAEPDAAARTRPSRKDSWHQREG